MLRFADVFMNRRGAVLLVVLFIILLLVGLAFAFTVVATTTYKAAQNEITAQQAAYDARSAAKVISNQLLEEQFITSRFINQLNTAGSGGILSGEYRSTNGEKGQFQIFYPNYDNKNLIHIKVTTVQGETAASVTTVLQGTPMELEDALDDYNLYVTSPNGTYNFNYMRAESGGIMKLYISTDASGNVFNLNGTFPAEAGTGTSQLTISGDLSIGSGTFNTIVTAYGTLNLSSVTINNNISVRDTLNMSSSSLYGYVTAYGNVNSTNTSSYGILAGGQVSVNGGSVGYFGGYSIRNKANVILNSTTLSYGINSQGNLVSITNSTVGGSVYAAKDVTVTGGTINGNVYVKGNLTLIDTVVNGVVRVDGNTLMNNSTINGSLDANGDVEYQGTSPNKITGNCTIDGKLTTCPLGSGLYHEFGVWGTTSTHLSIAQPTGDWDRGELAVILLSVKVAGTVKTPHKVVFMRDGTVNSGSKSMINTLYIQITDTTYGYRRLPGQTDTLGAYIRMFYSEINNLILATPTGTPLNTYLVYATIDNIYGKDLYLHTITQRAGGKIDGAYVYFFSTTGTNISGNVYSTGTVRITGSSNFYSSANIYAPSCLQIDANSTSTRAANFYAGGNVILNGPVGNLYLASNAVVKSNSQPQGIPSDVTVTTDIKSTSANTLVIDGTVTGSVYSAGPVIVNGTVGGHIKTPSTVTVNSGAVIGASGYQLYAGSGLIDNGGALIQANIYNGSTSRLEIKSTVNGYIYTPGAVTIYNNSDPIGGYVKAAGSDISYIKRSVNGSIQTGGVLNMYDTSYTGLVVGGDVKALQAKFYGTTVSGNVHATGSGSGTIQLEQSHIRKSAYIPSSTGQMRLGGRCTVGLSLSGSYTSRTAIYCGGQLNFSAWNIAYGNVYCGNYLSNGAGNIEGTGNTVHGYLYANTTVYINHSGTTSNAGQSSYTGIYAGGSVYINDIESNNGTCGYVRGTGTIDITNYTVTSEVFGPANITLNNTHAGKVHPRDGSTAPTHWVKLLNSSPVDGDVWSGNGFEQSAGSKIGGNLRVNNSSGVTIQINAAVQGTVHLPDSALVNVAPNLSYSAGVPRAVGGTLYATSGVTVGASSSIGGDVTCYNGNIVIGNYCPVLGNVCTDLTNGGTIAIGTNSPVSGGYGVKARGNIDIQTGSLVSASVYSMTGSVTLRSSVNGGVFAAGSLITTDGIEIKGNLRIEGTGAVTVNGSVYGDIWTNGPLTFAAATGGAGSRRIGTSGPYSLRCNGSLSIASQYYVYSSINNTTGNITVNNTVANSIECPNGTVYITGNVGGNVIAYNTVTIGGNISGNIYVGSDGTKLVTISGSVGGDAVIKGVFHQYGTVSGSMKIEGGYVPHNIYSFPGALTINGDLTLDFGTNYGSLGGVGCDINITGTLTINVDSAYYVNVYGRLICGSLRMNTTTSVGTIIYKAGIQSWTGRGRYTVRVYDDVHVQNYAYLLGATFYYKTASGPGSTVYVGRHLAARDCNFYAHGYTSTTDISDTNYGGSVSVGYKVTTSTNASAGDSGSFITQGCTVYSRTQVKGNVYYLDSITTESFTKTASEKVSHYIGGTLTVDNSNVRTTREYEYEMDTLIFVNGSCNVINGGIVGRSDWVSRENRSTSYEGIYVRGTLTLNSGCSIHCDVSASNFINNGLFQIAGKNTWWFTSAYWTGYLDYTSKSGSGVTNLHSDLINTGDNGMGKSWTDASATSLAGNTWCPLMNNSNTSGLSILTPYAPAVGGPSFSGPTMYSAPVSSTIGGNGSHTPTATGGAPSISSASVADIATPGIIADATGTITTVPTDRSTYVPPAAGNASAAATGSSILLSSLYAKKPADAYKWKNPIASVADGGLGMSPTTGATVTLTSSSKVTHTRWTWTCTSNGVMTGGEWGSGIETGSNWVGIEDEILLVFETGGQDMHVVMPYGYYIRWWKDDDNSILINGGGRVFIYMMGNNIISADDGEIIGSGSATYVDPVQRLYFISIGSGNYLYFNKIHVRATIYMPHSSSTAIFASDKDAHDVAGTVVAKNISFTRSGSGYYNFYKSSTFGLPETITMGGIERPLSYYLNAPETTNANYKWTVSGTTNN